MWDSVIVICFVVRYFVSILGCNHLDGEENAGCFAYFVFLVSGDCCVALPRGVIGLSRFMSVVFPDHTHYYRICPTLCAWFISLLESCFSLSIRQLSRDMRFPPMWYVRPAKAQTSLRIRTVRSEPLLVA